jgi:hypothetical protein
VPGKRSEETLYDRSTADFALRFAYTDRASFGATCWLFSMVDKNPKNKRFLERPRYYDKKYTKSKTCCQLFAG